MLKLFFKCLIFAFIFILGISVFAPSGLAEQVYVGNDPNKVGIVNQHPLARGEALYDTQPNATGRYNRLVDADTVNPARRYDALPEYYNDTDQKSLNLSLINGAWYCAPTSALSLVKYWDSDPRFPNLFDPGQGDTDRSVLLEMSDLMDTDDVIDKGGNDAQERHLGTVLKDVRPAIADYFNARYPNLFTVGERLLGHNGVTVDNMGYDTAVRRNIPTVLLFTGHMGVGIGFDTAFGRMDPRHYRINDPFFGSHNIGLDQLNQGKFLPRGATGVYGISYAEELYGPGAAEYDETLYGLSEDALAHGMLWVLPIEDPDLPQPVPEPASLLLVTSGLAAFWGVQKIRRK